jgi:hypothetical protein
MKTRSQRTTWSSVVAVLVTAFLVPSEVWAQEQAGTISPVTVGSRVRVQAPTFPKGQVEGLVMQMDDKSLLVSADDRIPVRLSRQDITRIEVSTGRKRQWLKGLMIGTSIGGVLGALADVTPAGSYCDFCVNSKGEAVAYGALGGAVWGAGIGALFKADHWNSVPLERVRVSLAPTRGRGVRLSASVAF